jgi:glycerol kinase
MFLLAIDQGTTSTRAMLFGPDGRPLASHAIALRQFYPGNGWVEHDAAEIWRATLSVCRKVMAGKKIAAIGVTNQRETSVIWDRKTGKPLHHAIVWQDRRTAARCAELSSKGWDKKIAHKTGLRLDPYFSATKLEWLLENVKGAPEHRPGKVGAAQRRTGFPSGRATIIEQAARGDILFGTIDSWLVWNLTGGKVHATDVSNASRTMLLNLKTLAWDGELLRLFGVPRAMLPDVRDSAGDFGMTHLFGKAIPILGVAGDQQAASIGQACFSPGDVKSTYGTGCFALVNTGGKITPSRNRLLTTALYRRRGTRQYAIEGSIFIAGAVVQWLRDAMGVIPTAPAIEALAKAAKPAEGLYVVPAFTGLGAPYWNPKARGAILGLTRDAGKAEIARAALDAVCYQTRDLLDAIQADMKSAGLSRLTRLKVDGGMVANDWFCQRLADLTGLAVERPKVIETTALGAAYLAGLGAGLFKDTKDIARHWALERRFKPAMKKSARDRLYQGWRHAIARIL